MVDLSMSLLETPQLWAHPSLPPRSDPRLHLSPWHLAELWPRDGEGPYSFWGRRALQGLEEPTCPLGIGHRVSRVGLPQPHG